MKWKIVYRWNPALAWAAYAGYVAVGYDIFTDEEKQNVYLTVDGEWSRVD